LKQAARVFAVLIAFVAMASSVFAEPYTENLIWGKVTDVSDGDTLTMQGDGKKMIRVQLAYIDAPDLDDNSGETQPLYRESTHTLRELTLNKEVIVESLGTDQFGRVEGMIFIDQTNINVEMVRLGMAELYAPVRFNPSKHKKEYVQQLLDAEELAKKAGTGVWGAEGYVSPYEFRRRHR